MPGALLQCHPLTPRLPPRNFLPPLPQPSSSPVPNLLLPPALLPSPSLLPPLLLPLALLPTSP
eukprot:3776100-Pleurochrysis_carterae.AAC.1